MVYELVIVGAGISGLAAALEARSSKIEDVLIVDYGANMGGFAKDLFTTDLFAPERDLLRQAADLPYEFRFLTTVVGLYAGENGIHQISLQGPLGAEDIKAKKIMLCSGSLQKPREAYRIAGSRPAGVMTPNMVLQILQRGMLPGKNILAIGNGRVMEGTVKLLAEHGCRTEFRESSNWGILEIVGNRRVEGVKLINKETGVVSFEEIDTLVFCQGRIPSTFYLKGGEIERDTGHAIVVDHLGRTNIPFISAAGSCTTLGDDEHINSEQQARTALRVLFGKDK